MITKEDLDQIEVVFIENVHEETADETVIDFKTRVVLINDQPGAFLLTEDNITKKKDDNLKQEVIDSLNNTEVTDWVVGKQSRSSTAVAPPYCTLYITFTDGSVYGISDIDADFKPDETKQKFYDLVADLEEIARKK